MCLLSVQPVLIQGIVDVRSLSGLSLTNSVKNGASVPFYEHGSTHIYSV